MKKIILIISITFTALVAFFFLFKHFTEKSENSSEKSAISKLQGQYEGIIVKSTELKRDLDVSGVVLPFDETFLTSEISGKIVKLNIQEGKAVKQGTLLVKLFDDDLQAQLKMLEVQLKIAKNNEQRMKTLLTAQGTSQQEYDASLLQVNNINAQIEILKVNIGKTEIKAPYDGILGLKKVSLGQYVNPSANIATIRATNNLKLDFNVPEAYSSMIKIGSTVNFTISGSSETYSANIIASESSIESDSRNLAVRALVKGTIKGLIPGAFAKVKLNLEDAKNSKLIPTSAIIAQASEKKVYVIKNGLAQFITIQTGLRQESLIEVISGLNEGDTVLTTGLLFVKPNMPIKLTKIN